MCISDLNTKAIAAQQLGEIYLSHRGWSDSHLLFTVSDQRYEGAVGLLVW